MVTGRGSRSPATRGKRQSAGSVDTPPSTDSTSEAPSEPVRALSKAAASGDRLKALEVLRDALAADLDACQSMRDKAALSLRFMDVLEQIDALARAGAAQKKGTPLDELAKRRAARGSDAKGSVRAAR